MFKSKLQVLKTKILSNRKLVAVGSGATVLCSTAVVHAEAGTADTDIVSAFTTIASNGVATVKGVALVGVGIMTVFLLWKYGKKIFNRVAN